ncbi:MGMT family protein [Candidatus Woesebacteria bacterium]|nr:MGMT family protein [Candidatus Woesebacteria bacterium]
MTSIINGIVESTITKTALSPLAQKVFAIVATIPRGQTTTYNAIAQQVGTSPRVVGNILHRNPDPDNYPCHRVIRSDGTLASGFAFGGKDIQRKLLLSEGVVLPLSKSV